MPGDVCLLQETLNVILLIGKTCMNVLGIETDIGFVEVKDFYSCIGTVLGYPLSSFRETKTWKDQINLLCSSMQSVFENIQVEYPADLEVLFAIHQTIEYILDVGPVFELMLMDRMQANKQFEFLYDQNVF